MLLRVLRMTRLLRLLRIYRLKQALSDENEGGYVRVVSNRVAVVVPCVELCRPACAASARLTSSVCLQFVEQERADAAQRDHRPPRHRPLERVPLARTRGKPVTQRQRVFARALKTCQASEPHLGKTARSLVFV